jgi:hypothetical protein
MISLDILYISIAAFAVMCGFQLLRIDRRLTAKRKRKLQRLKTKFK